MGNLTPTCLKPAQAVVAAATAVTDEPDGFQIDTQVQGRNRCCLTACCGGQVVIRDASTRRKESEEKTKEEAKLDGWIKEKVEE